MRRALFIASLGMLLAINARNAVADTITTGNLSFTCFPGLCVQNGSLVGTLPTAGSFVFDNTTNQFLSITLTWDGMSFSAAPFLFEATGEEAAYLELIGSGSPPLSWDAICSPDVFGLGHCAGEFGFVLFDHSTVGIGFGSSEPPLPTFPDDEAAGTVIATDLVTTPEPGAIALLLLGIAVALAAGKKPRAFNA